MHSVTCWTRTGYQYCGENEVCCSSGFYEYCCWDTSTVDAGVGLAAIMAIVGSFVFVTFIALLVIKCLCCKNRGQPGRVTGEISRPRLRIKYQTQTVSLIKIYCCILGNYILGRVRRVFSNRTYPTVHVNQHYNTVPPAASVREHVPGGQVFISPPIKSPQPDQRWRGAPPPYPGSPPTHGAHNTGTTNQSHPHQGHTQPNHPFPLPNHPTSPYPQHGLAQHSAPPLGFEQIVPASPREMAPPPCGAHGNVPPPFEYIPPKSDLYR